MGAGCAILRIVMNCGGPGNTAAILYNNPTRVKLPRLTLWRCGRDAPRKLLPPPRVLYFTSIRSHGGRTRVLSTQRHHVTVFVVVVVFIVVRPLSPLLLLARPTFMLVSRLTPPCPSRSF